MIELYLDTCDLQQVARFNQCLPLRGITTNPSILAKSGMGLNEALSSLAEIVGNNARFHAQVVSQSAVEMLEEAKLIAVLPYDMVVKVPATETGLTAIRMMKAEGLTVLATAIYSAHQGFLAALCGADYLAPYVNRIDALGVDGLAVVADLQMLLDQQALPSKILAASFKSTKQAMQVMKLGVGAITLPVEVVEQMFIDQRVQAAVDQFSQDWQEVFSNKLPYAS